ncbi:hypothetical protein [Salipiger sp. IMCC34102]|nr:hypothetical protein [Salipiger sp. IMCC34102]
MKPILTALAFLTLVACDGGMAMNGNANATMTPSGASAETATLGNTVVN